jgi:hypothetical protein
LQEICQRVTHIFIVVDDDDDRVIFVMLLQSRSYSSLPGSSIERCCRRSELELQKSA